MRLGFALPQIGQVAGPEALVAVAKRAEDLGFDSLWVLDRILWPVNPRAPYRSATVPQSKATAETEFRNRKRVISEEQTFRSEANAFCL